MFVSFTLDPMLSSLWHDPSIHPHGAQRPEGQPLTLYDRTIGRVTGWFDRATESLAEGYQHILRWALGHKPATLALALAIFVGSVFMVPLLGTEFVPKADFSETSINFTVKPLCANVCAIPLPIVPAPITAMFFIV